MGKTGQKILIWAGTPFLGFMSRNEQEIESMMASMNYGSWNSNSKQDE